MATQTTPVQVSDPDAGSGLPSTVVRVGPVDLKALHLWLGRSVRSPDIVAWPIVLLPDFLLTEGAMPRDSVERYQMVHWLGPIPAGPFDAVVRTNWVRSRGGRREFELATEARVDGRLIASCRIVCLTRLPMPALGKPSLPEAPALGELRQVRQMAMTESDVREFCRVSRTQYAATVNIRDAQVLGFRNVLVPGPQLTVEHLAALPAVTAQGSIEVWFKAPITAGSSLALCRSGVDQSAWSIRAVGTGLPATIASIRSHEGV